MDAGKLRMMASRFDIKNRGGSRDLFCAANLAARQNLHVLVAMVAGVFLVLCAGAAYGEQNATAPSSPDRIVNLGDSITDGQTYALLVEQALREAGKPTPHFFGAGLGGDNAAGMLKRIDRDVLVYHPTMVTLCTGINDVAAGVTMADYEATITAIAERLKSEKVRLMILTTSNLAPRLSAEEPALQKVNAVLHRVAAKFNLPVAEVYDRMQEARSKEPSLWLDGVHLNLAGFRCMARAILDAMGDSDVPVPTELHVTLLPGVIRDWKILPLHVPSPALDEKSVVALRLDDRWKTETLPEEKKPENFWLDQERRRGVAISLKDLFGPANSFIAMASYNSPTERDAFLNVGGDLHTAWFNGKRLYGPENPSKGWHPGGYRIPIHLQAGANQIVVETDGRFFVSVTDNFDW